MIEIKPKLIQDCAVRVPGSKSYTHRILIAAGLADGSCTIENGLNSEDTRLTINALQKMGVAIAESADGLTVTGTRGDLKGCKEPIYLGNSGTSMRLLTALAAIGQGTYTLTGTPRMQERPLQELLDGLQQIGIRAWSVNRTGCPPVKVKGAPVPGGTVALDCRKSSQYLSALLLIAPYTRAGLEIQVAHGPVSRPYIDMTLSVMQQLGIDVQRDGYRLFTVAGGQVYRAGHYTVEPDCSQAGYFWAAAAITGAAVKVLGIPADTTQGDVRFVELLEKMGCRVTRQSDGIQVAGGPLTGISVDMGDMPDLVPTLAVVAAFARGRTVIRNVAHLRVKESDRLTAVATELSRIGIRADLSDDGMRIEGGAPRGGRIQTYSDHRMAMSFALAGLRVPGIEIADETCVEKSFPEFWTVFDQLGQWP